MTLSTTLAFAHTDENHHNIKDLKNKAKNIIKQFAKTLKPELKKALKSGGAKHAVEVCNIQSPLITRNINAANYGWEVKRVSLKNRNINAKPNQWESKILKIFDKRATLGMKAEKSVYAKIVDKEFRFMKAQITDGVCLTCHGKNVSAEIKQIINAKYPQDKATGYSLGEVRGAFSLVKRLP